jgi:hypothetical protein
MRLLRDALPICRYRGRAQHHLCVPQGVLAAYNPRVDNIVKYIFGEWETISKAPVTFIIGLLVLAVVAYQAARYHLKERLQLRDDQIADYKNKLSGATPDEAKARIDRLEARVTQMEPRSLTDEQLASIARSLAGSSNAIDIALDMSVPEGKTISRQLTRIFQEAGWTIRNPSVLGVLHAVTGLFVGVKQTNSLTPPERRVVAALQASGIKFDLRPQPPAPGADVQICITSAP